MARLGTITVGFMAAVMTSSLAMIIMSAAVAIWEHPEQWVVLKIGLFLTSIFAVFVSVLSVLPFCLVVVVAELASIRTPIYYTVAGGLTGIVAYFPFWIQYQPFWEKYVGKLQRPHLASIPAIPSLEDNAVLLTCGLIGGLAYWVVSGRSAGRQKPTSPAPSGS